MVDRSTRAGEVAPGSQGHAGGKARSPARGRPCGGPRGRGEGRASLYEEVTTRIVGELEAGRFPWVQPWTCSPGEAGLAPSLPRNAVSQRAYSGINVLLLWGAVIARGWPTQGWLTYRQARALGGHVRKGEEGTCVVYADRFTPSAEKARANESGEEARSVPFLKRFTLFNLAQCEGLDTQLLEPAAPLPECAVEPEGEALIAASGVDFRIGGDKAFYAPGADFVQVPPHPAFHDPVNFYRTACHELCHATGHASRLGRTLTGRFGSKDYAREELVAELGAAFTLAALGIRPSVRHADYLGAWLEVLREDSRAIFRAASLASKAADWLLSRHEAAKSGAATSDREEGS
ncbi:ArdC family protein [Novosphingobium profundi]|uniref:ArdC family protein n=1 Tax=Novosphingobium profundi TaxID=1774954 RepID=UPI001CFE4D42|nr:zincin-like metallopeptidase domain-containing protein [Novosphingobium profundi]